MDHLREALDALAAAGWTVRERSAVGSPDDVWPAELRQRYPTIPPSLTQFVARVEACVNPDETGWFLSAADYAGTSDSAFAWNEWERMELESYEEAGDAERAGEVRDFWDAYLPFYLDVRSEYAYFAVRVTEPKAVKRQWWSFPRQPEEPRLGAVVFAAEEFRSVSEVAGSFDAFLDELAATVQGRTTTGPLTGLI